MIYGNKSVNDKPKIASSDKPNSERSINVDKKNNNNKSIFDLLNEPVLLDNAANVMP